ncbi:hypothetical protein Droror1_Dr00023981 [Drosera rotundifolia]
MGCCILRLTGYVCSYAYLSSKEPTSQALDDIKVHLKLLKPRDQLNIISIGAYLIPGIPKFHFLQCDLQENRLPNREGCCRWRSISQILLQMQPWTLRDQSIKLHNSRASALLSPPPLSALKQKGNFSQLDSQCFLNGITKGTSLPNGATKTITSDVIGSESMVTSA